MIQLFTGNPGGGKSYDMVRNRLIPVFKTGREIWTNLDGLNLDYICALEGVQEHFKDNIVFLVDDMDYEMMTAEEKKSVEERKSVSKGNTFRFWFQEFTKNGGSKGKKGFSNESKYEGIHRSPSGRRVCSIWEFYMYVPETAMVIIDEAQNYWSAKDWQGVPESFDKYLSLHRHFGNDIIFATQKPVRVYKEVQRLAEYVWKFEKLGWLGVPTRYKAIVQIGLDDKRVYKRHVRKYDKKYFPCYKSYTASDIKEQKIESTKMFSPIKIAAVALVLVFLLFRFVNLPWFTGGRTANASVKKPNDLKTMVVSSKQGANSGRKESVGGIYQEQKLDSKRKPIGKPVIYELNSSNEWVKKDVVNKKTDKLAKPDKPVSSSVPGMPDRFYNSSRRPVMSFNPIMVQNDNIQASGVSMVAENVVKSSGSGYACSGDECYSVINGEVVAVKR
mgnify:CR=1 FL=1